MATLESKTIIIFGGSSGIGYSVAEACLLSRASLVIIASSSVDRVTTAVRRLQAAKLGVGKVHGAVVDARDHAALKEFVTRIGEVDHVVWTSGDKLKVGFPDVDVESMKGISFTMCVLNLMITHVGVQMGSTSGFGGQSS